MNMILSSIKQVNTLEPLLVIALSEQTLPDCVVKTVQHFSKLYIQAHYTGDGVYAAACRQRMLHCL